MPRKNRVLEFLFGRAVKLRFSSKTVLLEPHPQLHPPSSRRQQMLSRSYPTTLEPQGIITRGSFDRTCVHLFLRPSTSIQPTVLRHSGVATSLGATWFDMVSTRSSSKRFARFPLHPLVLRYIQERIHQIYHTVFALHGLFATRTSNDRPRWF